MKRGSVALALTVTLTASVAGAQDLSAYRSLASSLEAASKARTQNAAQALAALDRAEGAYAKLAPTVQNKQLLGGLRDALDGAKAALARTPAELQAQVLLGRGLMRRALYDQTLAALAQAPANGSAQLRLLAQEFGIQGAATQALSSDAKAGRLERVAWRLQRTAAQKVGTALRATAPRRSAASYLSLAQATSWFTIVQEAGGAQTLRVSQFTDALRQLTAGDVPGLTASLATLRQGTAALQRSLATPPAAGKGGKQSAGPQAPQAGTPPQKGQAGSPKVSTPKAPSAGTPADRPAAGRAAGSGETGASGTTRSSSEVSGAGSVAAAYAALGRALAATGHADNTLARSELTRADAAVGRLPAALKAAPGFERLRRDLSAAAERRGLRPGDVQALISQLTGLERGAVGGTDQLSAGAARGFGGGLRALLFLALALLALVPLYLLNLAFGGRNTYWRAISAALALLLLPTFLEGLFGFLGWLGDLTGAGALRALSNVTLTQGAYGPAFGALLTALAIGLATYGFRGLCVQFGLLGADRKSPAPAQSGIRTNTKTSTRLGTSRTREWDEEA